MDERRKAFHEVHQAFSLDTKASFALLLLAVVSRPFTYFSSRP